MIDQLYSFPIGSSTVTYTVKDYVKLLLLILLLLKIKELS